MNKIKLQFKECAECEKKPGSPPLCASCLHNRAIISDLQEEPKLDVNLEGVLKIVKLGELIAVVHNNMEKKSQEFYNCKKMGIEDIKNLLLEIKDGKL